MSKTKILITGSGGFIASNLTRYILKNYSEYTITGIDRCDNPNLLNTVYSNKGYSFYIGDVNNSHFLHTVFELEKPEIVIHLAYSDSDLFNFTGLQNLIKESSINDSKLILISSYEVYSESFSENTETKPKTNVGLFKDAQEKYLKLNYDKYLILRPSKVFGPKQSKDKFIPSIINACLNKQDIIIDDNHSSTYSWIHVQDFCSALMSLINKQNETYNISTNISIPNYEIVKTIENKIESLKTIFNGSRNEVVLPNTNLLKEGWLPAWKFKNGLEDTVDWYLKNKYFLK